MNDDCVILKALMSPYLTAPKDSESQPLLSNKAGGEERMKDEGGRMKSFELGTWYFVQTSNFQVQSSKFQALRIFILHPFRYLSVTSAHLPCALRINSITSRTAPLPPLACVT